LIAAVGGLVLIIDVLEGPARWSDPTALREWLASIRDRDIKMANELPGPPVYSPEDKAELVRKAHEDYKQAMSDLDRRVAADTLRDKYRGRRRALIGFLLLAIGSVMQAVGAGLM
jgi:hypothetical protein